MESDRWRSVSSIKLASSQTPQVDDFDQVVANEISQSLESQMRKKKNINSTAADWSKMSMLHRFLRFE